MSFDEPLAAATGLHEALEKTAALTSLPAEVDRDRVGVLGSPRHAHPILAIMAR